MISENRPVVCINRNDYMRIMSAMKPQDRFIPACLAQNGIDALVVGPIVLAAEMINGGVPEGLPTHA